MKFFTRVLAFLFIVCAPLSASAHEVYVLTQGEIAKGLSTPAFSLWGTLMANLDDFVFWAFIGVLIVFIVFFAGVSRMFERWLDPLLAKLPPYAPLVGRVTIGLSFLAAAYYQALFGPELPLAATFGAFAPAVTTALVIIGLMIIVGFYARVAALVALALFAYETAAHGWYMLTYANYFGEIILILILGAHKFAIHHKEHDTQRAPRWFLTVKRTLTPLAFPLLRLAFGISLLYASLYAKFLHDVLALQVASLSLAGHMESLATALGFEPHFLVLGAGIVEIVIALFFILGIEIRFTALFLEFWLTLSLIYFGEIVWPHLILIGIPISFFFYGYDTYSLEGFFFKKKGREPVL